MPGHVVLARGAVLDDARPLGADDDLRAPDVAAVPLPARSSKSARRTRWPPSGAAPIASTGEQVGDAEEVGDVRVGRLGVDLARRADLRDAAVVHDREAVAHRQRLLLVVGDVDERDADVASAAT